MELEPFPQPEKYSQPHKVHRTGADLVNKITFTNEPPLMMDPYMKPQVWLGAPKQIVHHPVVNRSETKFRS